MTKKKNETFDEIVTPTYRGPDRRKPKAGNGVSKPKIRVSFDKCGNASLAVGDDTLDRLQALDPDALSLEG